MKEDIIRMAREAKVAPMLYDGKWAITNLDRFAALVADRCAEIAYEAEPWHSADLIRQAFNVKDTNGQTTETDPT